MSGGRSSGSWPAPAASRRARSSRLPEGAWAGAVPSTESSHPEAERLDRLTIRQVVELLHSEDRRAFDAVGEAIPSISQAARLVVDALSRGGRLIYVGAGTSGRLALLDAVECPPTFGTSPTQVQAILAGGRRAIARAVEGAEDETSDGAAQIRRRRVSHRDVVCGVSASATTAFVLGALKQAKRSGAKTILVCCARPPQRGLADRTVLLRTGPELIAGSTRLKAGTATKLALNAISTSAMVALGKVYRGRMVDLRATNQKLKERARRMVEELAGLSASQAAALLRRSGGSPKLALAIHLTGMDEKEARRTLRRSTLRQLDEAKDQPLGVRRRKAKRVSA